MKRTDGLNKISNSLISVGLNDLARNIDRSMKTVSSSSKLFDGFVTAIETYAQEETGKRTAMLLKRSSMPTPASYSDLWNYDVRHFDYEQLEYILDLPFVKERRNLVIDGPPGTGKLSLPGSDDSILTTSLSQFCRLGLTSKVQKNAGRSLHHHGIN